MKKIVLVAISFSMLAMTGCARYSKVIVDPHGTDMSHYQADLAECRQLAEQVESKVGKGVVGGAVVGGIAGEIVGGSRSTDVGIKLGALSGALKGGRATRRERDRVVKNCLRNRGYKVLN